MTQRDWIKVKDIPGINEVVSGHLINNELTPPFEAYRGDDPYIFVSYAHRDSKFVFAELENLHNLGYKVWYDEGIEASSEWPEEIANALIGCKVFLVFISPRSTASVNCRNEINLALNEGKPFLAVHLEESPLPPACVFGWEIYRLFCATRFQKTDTRRNYSIRWINCWRTKK